LLVWARFDTDVCLGPLVEMSLDKDAADCHAEVVVDIANTCPPAWFLLVYTM